MKTNEHALMIVLTLSAVILSVMLISSWNSKALAESAARPDNSDYIMVAGSISDSRDVVYVIDVPNQDLLVYAADGINNRTQPVSKVNLETVFR